MKQFFFFILIAISINVMGQTTIEVYSDKSFIYLREEIALKNQFLDSVFYNGKVLFKNGKSSNALMNYNLIDNGISFVQDKKIVILTGLEDILFVTYNKRIFIPYQDTFLEQIEDFGNNVLLLLKRKTILKTNSVSGAYGMNSQSSNIGKFSYLSGNGIEQNYTDLNKNVTIDVTLETDYFIKIDDKIKPLNRIKVLMKLFPNKKNSLLDFISTNNIKITESYDLKKMIRFCLSD
ncbi:MAG: hypothetical protein EHM93_01840 [Bacteroidales bacterium]|nr:MAG: hypothetical protein EHM93_01840 [Bacteroidales bacterium]